jgi:hypothetical protein
MTAPATMQSEAMRRSGAYDRAISRSTPTRKSASERDANVDLERKTSGKEDGAL